MYRHPPPPPPRAPKSPLKIVAIVAAAILGVLAVGGYLALHAYDASRAMKEVWTGEAGPPMTQQEVLAALAGPKKDYVGRWTTPMGSGVLQIGPDARVAYAGQRGFANGRANGRIESFTDDAFYVMTFRFSVEKPPERVGGRWVMRVRGQTWERD
jgi:hypothetical protein